MQDQPVMGMLLIVSWNVVFDRAFDRVHVFAHRYSGTVTDTKDMRVNRLRGDAPPHIQNHICGLAPDPPAAIEAPRGNSEQHRRIPQPECG